MNGNALRIEIRLSATTALSRTIFSFKLYNAVYQLHTWNFVWRDHRSSLVLVLHEGRDTAYAQLRLGPRSRVPYGSDVLSTSSHHFWRIELCMPIV